MEQKKKRLLVFITAICLFSITLISLITGQIIGNNKTDVKVDFQNKNINYAMTDSDNSLVIYSTKEMALCCDNSNGSHKWIFRSKDNIFKDKINFIKTTKNHVYVSLLNQRRILKLDIQDGTLLNVYQSTDPVSFFELNDEETLLAVISTLNSKSYLTIFDVNLDASIYDENFELTKEMENLFEKYYTTKIVNVLFDANKFLFALRNGQVYELDPTNTNAKPTLYIDTGISLSSVALTKNKKFIAISDKGEIKRYENKENIDGLDISEDVFCVGSNKNTNIIALGTRFNKMCFYDAEKGDIVTKYKVYNEPSYIDISNSGIMSVSENLSSRAIIIDLAKVNLLSILDILNVVILILHIISIAFFLLALFNFFDQTREKQIKFFKSLRHILWKHKKSYLVLLPTFILLGIFSYYPTIWSLSLAFTEYKPGVYTRFVGFANFKEMFMNEYFWVGTGNMLIFLVTDLLKALIPPIIMAELIFAIRSKTSQYWVRVLMYVPGILPGIAGLMIWTTGILGMEGLINMLFKNIGLGYLVTDWLGNPSTALWALIFIGFPFVGGYLLFYGSLMSVPSSLIEASKIDGCTWFMRIIKIDVPLIGPQIKYIFITGFIGSIQDFGRVWLTTGGGPGKATYIPALELYNNISIFNNYGLASAMGLFLFIIIFGITLFNLKIKTNADLG